MDDCRERLEQLIRAVTEVVVCKESTVRLLVTALLGEGHVLLEDVPGVGKTTLAKTFSTALSLSFSRIQCTPDTLPSDIIGVSVYRADEKRFEPVLGPVNHQILLADELNRTSPKTQAALLEAMEEAQVTIDGAAFPLPRPFFVLATQNPNSSSGTYLLPEAQLDRFMMKLSMGYPDQTGALELMKRFLTGELQAAPEAVLTADMLLAAQKSAAQVRVDDALRAYVEALVSASREAPHVACGLSPRAMLDLLRAAQAFAFLAGRDYCIPEDIYTLVLPVCAHRLVLTGEAKMNRVSEEDVMKKIRSGVQSP